ncbi:MAG: hypothetical protein HRJ53_08315 [Acidobacteria bacterium Pan2503]|uniref:Uncharacterized protein n=1 Tax=Candidatus Acidiferrum panamense TaxID=2741543 RepID=A0A7V8NPT5_9BACT|nr:hypothetical protein [Candidatus Acidoferrum panamensis]
MTQPTMRPEDYGTEYLNGHAPAEPPRVAFGTAKTQNIPIEWAAWILTAMRDAELAGRKPQHFSAWLAAAGREVQ